MPPNSSKDNQHALTNTNKQNVLEDQNDEIGFSEMLSILKSWVYFLRKQWILLIVFGLIGSCTGFLLAMLTPITYAAKLSFVLEEAKPSGGGLSALAGQFGLDLGSMSGSSNMLAGDNIIGLLKSRRFTKGVLLTPYDENDKKYSLADKYAEVYELRERWEKSKIGKKIFFPPSSSYTLLQDSLLQIIETNILNKQLVVQRPDKKMSFFEVKAIFRDQKLAKAYTERLVSTTIDFYIETKTRRLRANVNRLQHRADSIASLLNSRTFSAAAAQSRVLDINPAYQVASVGAEVTTREKSMTGVIYGEIVKNLEIQKATLTQETPVIQIVDAPTYPLQKNKKSKLLYLVVGFFIGEGLIILFIIGKKLLSSRRLTLSTPI